MSAPDTQPLQLAGKPLYRYQCAEWTDESNNDWRVYYTVDNGIWIAGFGIGDQVIEATHFSPAFRRAAEICIADEINDEGDYRDTDRYRNELAFDHARGRI